MKKCSGSIDIREIQRKTTRGFHLSFEKKKTMNAREDAGERSPQNTAGGNVNNANRTTMRGESMESPHKSEDKWIM